MRPRALVSTLGLFGFGLFAATLATASCGARSSLEIPPPAPPLPKCVVDADCDGFNNKCRNVHCELTDGTGGAGSTSQVGASTGTSGQALTLSEGRCVEGKPVDCNDSDPCTLDKCNADSGACEYTPAAVDLDKDGHKGPREGTKAGAPGSCGDDCDDTNPNAYPGNKEVCDGVDNDCNGIVDDNATFIPLDAEPRQISEHATASPGSLAYNGTNYNASFTESTSGQNGGADMYTTMLTAAGDKIPPGQQTIDVMPTADSFGGSVLWTGDRFGIAWQARPTGGSYQVFFSMLDDMGKKFHDDIQVSHTTGTFAINQDIGFTGNNFVVLWQDDRSGNFNIYGRVFDLSGVSLTGDKDVRMTDTAESGFPNESPVVAATSQGIGVVWSRGDNVTHFVRFQRFNFDLTPIGKPIDITDGSSAAVYPTVVFNHDRYVISWFDKSKSPEAIYATVLDQDGNTLVAPKAVTSPGPHHSRYPFMRALGDRILFVYADDRDNNQGYELYSRVIDNDLKPVSAELRLTNAPGDSIYPRAAFGPKGDVGVLFRDDRSGEQHVWFTRLGCVAGTTPP